MYQYISFDFLAYLSYSCKGDEFVIGSSAEKMAAIVGVTITLADNCLSISSSTFSSDSSYMLYF